MGRADTHRRDVLCVRDLVVETSATRTYALTACRGVLLDTDLSIELSQDQGREPITPDQKGSWSPRVAFVDLNSGACAFGMSGLEDRPQDLTNKPSDRRAFDGSADDCCCGHYQSSLLGSL